MQLTIFQCHLLHDQESSDKSCDKTYTCERETQVTNDRGSISITFGVNKIRSDALWGRHCRYKTGVEHSHRRAFGIENEQRRTPWSNEEAFNRKEHSNPRVIRSSSPWREKSRWKHKHRSARLRSLRVACVQPCVGEYTISSISNILPSGSSSTAR